MSYRSGETHHRAKYSNEIVERARTMHDQGFGPRCIADVLNVPINTLNWWIYYRGRASG